MSTTLNPGTAINYFGKLQERNFNSIVYKINMPVKYKAGLGMFDESEIVFKPDSKFKVKRIQKWTHETNKAHKYIIELDYLE